jgi:putative transposase
MLVDRAYKAELDLNNVQRTTCLRHAGTARFTYNWGLQRKKESYQATGRSPTAIDLHRELNRLKRTDFPWMYEVSKCAPQESLRDLDRAYRNFFEGRAKYPKFKSRKRGIGSFRLTGSIRVFENAIQIPRVGRIRLKEHSYLPTIGVHIHSATVSEHAGRWFVSLQVEKEIEVPENVGSVAGVDVGVSHLAAVSDGTLIESPRALLRCDRKLRRLQRSSSRKKLGSRNRAKANRMVARCHFRIANIRSDAMHKITTMLVKTKSVIGVEKLAVKNMLANHCIAKSLSDAGLGEFKRQLKYKAIWYGSTMVEADRFFPSTKRCSACGAVKLEMPLSERVFRCERCGFEADRDMNAALNLESVAASWVETLNACERREVHALWQVPADEAGTEHYLGDVLNG